MNDHVHLIIINPVDIPRLIKKRTVRVIDEEIVDQDRHRHQYPHHRHRRHHQHHLDQVIRFDEKVQQIHVIVIQNDNTIVNDVDDHSNIIIGDDQDRGQEDSKLKLVFFKDIIRDHFNSLQNH